MGQYCTPEHVTGGAAVGDYDGDGLEDVYFTVFHDRSVLYKNNGEFCLAAFNTDLKCLPLSLPSTRVNMFTKRLSNCLLIPVDFCNTGALPYQKTFLEAFLADKRV